MKIKSLPILPVLCVSVLHSVGCQTAASQSAQRQTPSDSISIPSDFMCGFDASTVDFLEEKGAVYRDENGKAQDIFKIVKSHGVNWIRLRMWHDPSKNDEAGDNSFERTIRTAKRVKDNGLHFLLDFHYSDSWADPGKQKRPSAWDAISTIDELAGEIGSYTRETLEALKENGCLPDMVQLGNEINPGFCTMMSDGSPSNIPISSGENNDEGNKNLVMLLKSACEAVKGVDSHIKRMIHLASDGSWADLSWWFERINGFDFEVIGLSYYIFENHGTISELQENIKNLKARYNKEVCVVETSWAWRFDKVGKDEWKNYVHYEKGVEAAERLSDSENFANISANISALKELRIIDQNGKKCVEASVKNQEVVVRAIIEATATAGGCGVFYWGGDWICDPNGIVGNNWANQALFNREGKCLSSMSAFRLF